MQITEGFVLVIDKKNVCKITNIHVISQVVYIIMLNDGFTVHICKIYHKTKDMNIASI